MFCLKTMSLSLCRLWCLETWYARNPLWPWLCPFLSLSLSLCHCLRQLWCLQTWYGRNPLSPRLCPSPSSSQPPSPSTSLSYHQLYHQLYQQHITFNITDISSTISTTYQQSTPAINCHCNRHLCLAHRDLKLVGSVLQGHHLQQWCYHMIIKILSWEIQLGKITIFVMMMIVVKMMILVMLLAFDHLPLLLCSDQRVLILMLVQNGDLVIQNLVVHSHDWGYLPG